MVATVQLPALEGHSLSGDDAFGRASPWDRSNPSGTFSLPDGYTMQWEQGARPLRAKQAAAYKFRLLDPTGQPPKDMAFYMGMLGHAAFVKTDGTVFAHIHPGGSASMAALMLIENQKSADMTMDPTGPVDHGSMSIDLSRPWRGSRCLRAYRTKWDFPMASQLRRLSHLCSDEARRYGRDRCVRRSSELA